MPLDLLRVSITPDSTIQELCSIFPIQDRVNLLLKETLIDLQDTAVGAYQSTVPIDTSQLRNLQIRTKFTGALSFSVYVADTIHTATRGSRKSKPTGAELAEILDNGISEISGAPLLRRENSEPAFNRFASFEAIGRGSPTAGWIEDAEKQLDEVIDKVIDG